MGVSQRSVYEWEHYRAQPAISNVPNILSFLGYCISLSEGGTRGEQIRMRRYRLGLGRRKLAQILGIHDTVLALWENNHTEPPIGIESRLDQIERSPTAR